MHHLQQEEKSLLIISSAMNILYYETSLRGEVSDKQIACNAGVFWRASMSSSSVRYLGLELGSGLRRDEKLPKGVRVTLKEV